MLMLDVLVQPPFVTDHLRTFVPVPNAVTVLADNVGFVMAPLPDISDQVPIPEVGEVAARTVVGELIHNV